MKYGTDFEKIAKAVQTKSVKNCRFKAFRLKQIL